MSEENRNQKRRVSNTRSPLRRVLECACYLLHPKSLPCFEKACRPQILWISRVCWAARLCRCGIGIIERVETSRGDGRPCGNRDIRDIGDRGQSSGGPAHACVQRAMPWPRAPAVLLSAHSIAGTRRCDLHLFHDMLENRCIVDISGRTASTEINKVLTPLHAAAGSNH